MHQEFERYMTDDLRIKEIRELTPPTHLIHEFPCTDLASATVQRARTAAHRIIHGEDDRLLVIVGPCSIHDPKAAREYAERLVAPRSAGKALSTTRIWMDPSASTTASAWPGD